MPFNFLFLKAFKSIFWKKKTPMVFPLAGIDFRNGVLLFVALCFRLFDSVASAFKDYSRVSFWPLHVGQSYTKTAFRPHLFGKFFVHFRTNDFLLLLERSVKRRPRVFSSLGDAQGAPTGGWERCVHLTQVLQSKLIWKSHDEITSFL